MNKKSIAALAGIFILLVVVVNLAIRKNRNKGYVIDQSRKIRLQDIETYYKRVDFNAGNTKDYFSSSILNATTLKLFLFLDDRFRDSKDMADHLEKIRAYLHSIMPADEAEKLYELYKTYMKYQAGLREKLKEWGLPRTPEESIELLRKLQEYRREFFGNEVADSLFGASIKAEEYPIRRAMILNDKDMYGAEKEEKIKQLNRDMWEDEADTVERYTEPYTRYREKLKMYEKDFAEMGEGEKQSKIRQFREEFFTPDQVERLEDVDTAIAENKKREDDYRTAESRIMSDPDLDKEEKEKRIQELQNQTFGEEAGAFRRRLAIEKATREQFKK